MTFTIQEGGVPIAQVEGPPTAALHVHQRPLSPLCKSPLASLVRIRLKAARDKQADVRMPPDPLPIPPRGFVVLSEREAKMFGLGR